MSLAARIKDEARRLGFDRVGIAPVRESDHGEFYRRWIEDGRHGEMRYLARPDAVERRLDPRSAWPELRTAVVVAHNYYPGDDGDAAWAGARSRSGDADDTGERGSASRSGGNARAEAGGPPGPRGGVDPTAETPAAGPTAGDPSRGVVARYARGRDYHKIIKKKLLELLRFVEGEAGRELPVARAYVDTGPVFERELARRAGIGWFGRNTMLIDPRRGSYFFLGTLLLELELEHDAPFETDRCGSCRACVDACPTGALLGRDVDGAPVIDATRCISYLTIEQRGAIPHELRPRIGNRIFGCDICQEVCPWNGRKLARITAEPDYAARGPGEPPPGVEPLEPAAGGDDGARATHPGTASPSLIDLLRTALDPEAWDAFSRGSAIRRAGRAGFARNVCVAMGNWLATVEEPPAAAVAVLNAALEDAESLVREHAAWALGRRQSR